MKNIKYIPTNCLKLIFSFCIILFFAHGAKGQVLPVGNGVNYPAICIHAHNNDIYVATRRPGATKARPYDTITIARWNGFTWSNLPGFIIYTGMDSLFWPRTINAMSVFRGSLYVGGQFDSVVNVKDGHGILQFSEGGWKGVGGGLKAQKPELYAHAVALAVYKNKLYVSGFFGGAGSIKATKVAAWDGIAWSYLGSSEENQGIPGDTMVHDMLVYKNDLYMTGASGWTPYKLWKWNGSAWDAGTKLTGMAQPWHLTQYEGSLVIGGTGAEDSTFVRQGDGTEWKYLYDGPNPDFQIILIVDIEGHKDKLWLIGEFYDKHSGKIFNLLFRDKTGWNPVHFDTSIAHHVWGNGGYSKNLLAGNGKNLFMIWPHKEIGKRTINFVGQLSAMVPVRGTAYADANANCRLDEGEIRLSNHLIEFDNGLHYTLTDENGNYKSYVDTGKIEIRLIPKKHWRAGCPLSDTLTVKGKDTGYAYINFSATPISKIKDLRVNLTAAQGWRARSGFTEIYTLTCENIGTLETKDITLYLSHDDRQSQFAAYPKEDAYVNRKGEWQLMTLNPGQKFSVTILMRTDSSVSNDSSLVFAWTDSFTTITDSVRNDNNDTLRLEVVAAKDPNDKQCFPSGKIKPGTKELRYHIRFQNTGTDTAYRVEVIDTIDVNLPLTKIYINSSSHKYQLKIRDNVLHWTFNNIMLPDSHVNEPLSHGFINYSAMIKPGLAVGTEIKNTAYIYFDYQLPVQTNTALSLIWDDEVSTPEEWKDEAGHLSIYPNPARNWLYIHNTDVLPHSLTIINSVGQVMEKLEINPSELQLLQMGNRSPGLYFIRTETGASYKVIVNR